MPQLDKVTLFSQMIWLISIFLVFFIIVRSKILPTLSMSLKIRQRWLNQMNTNKNNAAAIGAIIKVNEKMIKAIKVVLGKSLKNYPEQINALNYTKNLQGRLIKSCAAYHRELENNFFSQIK